MKKNDEKLRVLLGFAMVAMAILGVWLYLGASSPADLSEMFILGPVLVLVIGAAYIIIERAKALKKGLPTEDEFLKRVNYKSGYYSFIAGIWISLGVGFSEDFLVNMGLSFRHGTTIVLLAMGLVFICSYLILSKRGSVE